MDSPLPPLLEPLLHPELGGIRRSVAALDAAQPPGGGPDFPMHAAAALIGAHALILAQRHKGRPEILHEYVGDALAALPRQDLENVLAELTLSIAEEVSVAVGEQVIVITRTPLAGLGSAHVLFAAFPMPTSKRMRMAQLQCVSELLAHVLTGHQARVARSAIEDGLKDAFDHCDSGMILVGPEGTIVFANAEAQRLIAEGDGLRAVNGMIQAATFEDSMKVRLAIERTFRSSDARHDFMLPIRRSAGRRPLIATVQPLHRSPTTSERQRSLLNVLDPDRTIDGALALQCGLLGLTPVETRLALQLSLGVGLGEAAAAIGVKEQTARSYLKNIFGKTGTNRQADLVRFLLTGLTPIRCRGK